MKADDLDHMTFEVPSRFESWDLKIAQDATPFRWILVQDNCLHLMDIGAKVEEMN